MGHPPARRSPACSAKAHMTSATAQPIWIVHVPSAARTTWQRTATRYRAAMGCERSSGPPHSARGRDAGTASLQPTRTASAPMAREAVCRGATCPSAVRLMRSTPAFPVVRAATLSGTALNAHIADSCPIPTMFIFDCQRLPLLRPLAPPSSLPSAAERRLDPVRSGLLSSPIVQSYLYDNVDLCMGWLHSGSFRENPPACVCLAGVFSNAEPCSVL